MYSGARCTPNCARLFATADGIAMSYNCLTRLLRLHLSCVCSTRHKQDHASKQKVMFRHTKYLERLSRAELGKHADLTAILGNKMPKTLL